MQHCTSPRPGLFHLLVKSAEDVLLCVMMWHEGDDLVVIGMQSSIFKQPLPYAIYSGNILLQQTTLRGSVLSHDQCLEKLETWMVRSCMSEYNHGPKIPLACSYSYMRHIHERLLPLSTVLSK